MGRIFSFIPFLNFQGCFTVQLSRFMLCAAACRSCPWCLSMMSSPLGIYPLRMYPLVRQRILSYQNFLLLSTPFSKKIRFFLHIFQSTDFSLFFRHGSRPFMTSEKSFFKKEGRPGDENKRRPSYLKPIPFPFKPSSSFHQRSQLPSGSDQSESSSPLKARQLPSRLCRTAHN